VLFSGQASRAKGARLAMESYQQTKNERLTVIKARRKQLVLKLEQLRRELEYYQEEGLELADEILKTAKGGYREGEIDFFQYIQSLEHSYEIQLAYLEQLRAYNEVVLSLNFSNP
jgi:cobalt-zinc-cadmium resistance protein CzcA